MKITSSLPSQLALATDVTDRDIFSHLDVSTQTLFALETVPDTARGITPSTNVARTSFSVFTAASVANAAASNTVLATLDKGLWVIDVLVQYVANYAQLTGSGLNISLSASGVQGLMLISLAPVVGTNLIVRTTVKFLLNVNHELAFFLLNNGVGQAHSANVTVNALKYL